jgi:hypothetical protein
MIVEPNDSELQRWQTIYSNLLDIERLWTAQIQNQQQRVSTLLTVNGFLLGFLATAGFSEAIVSRGPWPGYLFLASLTVLSVGLMMGILSLRSQIPISGAQKGATWKDLLRSFRRMRRHRGTPPEAWLDAAEVLRLFADSREEHAIRQLCKSLEESQAKADHAGVLAARRTLMYRELSLLILGLVLLVAALLAFQIAR